MAVEGLFPGSSASNFGASSFSAAPKASFGGLGASGAFSVAMTIGQEIMSGIQRKKQAKRARNAALTTGANLLQQASDIETAGSQEQFEFIEQSRRDESSYESYFADAGIGLTGSVIDNLLDQRSRLKREELKIQEATRVKAKASRSQAAQSLQEAEYAQDAVDHSFFGMF